MMSYLRNARLIIIVRGVLIAAVIAAAVFLYFYDSFTPPMQRTTQGVLFEELLPQDVLFAVSFNPTDEEERKRFNVLWNAVLQDKAEVVLPFLVQTLAGKNKALLTINDTANLFGQAPRMLFSLAKNKKEDNTSAFYFFSEVPDAASARATLAGIQAKDALYKTEIENEKQFVMSHSGSKTVYIGIVRDTVFATNIQKENLADFLRRFEKKSRSFARTRLFKDAVSRFAAPFSGYAFVSDSLSDEKETSIIKATASSFRASEDGITFATLALGDHKPIKFSPAAALLKPYDAYLYKAIPADRAMLFAEAQNFGAILNVELDILQNKLGFSRQSIADGFKNFTGLDLFADMLPALNKGFAVVMQDAASIIPGVSLYIDVSGAQDEAGQIVKKIDEAAQSWISLANIALKSDQNAPLEYARFESAANYDAGGDMHADINGGIFKFYFDRVKFTEGAEIPLFKLLQDPLQISYGLIPDNILFVSTLPDFKEAYAAKKTIEPAPLFADLQKLDSQFGSLTLIDGNFIGEFIERIVALARSEKSWSEGNEVMYTLLKRHLAPIKGFLQASQGDGRDVTGKGLLKINTPP